jgi:hypothetical protein
VQIRFTSSLTPEDEDRVAPVVLKVLGSVLDALPIAYIVQIETSGSNVYRLAHSAMQSPDVPASTEADVVTAGARTS